MKMKTTGALAIFTLAVTTLVNSTCVTHPVDCQVSYGDWCSCDPCTKTQSRHIYIVTPAQSGGMQCPGNYTENKNCTTTETCLKNINCGPDMFLCSTGRCIAADLQCNGEDDCGDNSDERNCTDRTYPRSIEKCMELPEVPYLDLVGSGYDPLTDQIRGRVLDNDRYDGYCRKAKDGDRNQTYRLPYNVDAFHFQVNADGESHAQTYNSIANYTQANSKSTDNSYSVSAGYHFLGQGVSTSVSGSNSNLYKSLFNTMSTTQSQLYQVGTKVELAQFFMKSNPLILDPFFLQAIQELPAAMDPKAYNDFVTEYGTHYLQGGSLGGIYEYNYVYHSSNNSASSSEENDIKNTFQFQFNANLFGFKNSDSYSNNNEQKNQKNSYQEIDQSSYTKVVNIKGGTSRAAGALTLAINSTSNSGPPMNKYMLWVDSLKQNPALISKQLAPICDIFYYIADPNIKNKTINCVNAVNVYLQHSATENCSMPCFNGGQVVNIDKTCYCACPAGYTGQQCATKISKVNSNTTSNMPSTDSTTSKLKFITNNGMTRDPLPLNEQTVGEYDQILKGKGNMIYYISSPTGKIENGVGYFTLVTMDENLMNKTEQFLNFSNINCIDYTCKIIDFDLDSDNNIVVSVAMYQLPNQLRSSVYKLLPNGDLGYTIDDPCDIYGQLYPFPYVTINCQDELIVGCYATPATLRLYTPSGYPDQVIQFPDLNAINSLVISEIDGSLWLHTVTDVTYLTLQGQVVGYDIATWQRTFYLNREDWISNSTGFSVYTELIVDFEGNVIVGQESTSGTHSNFLIVDTTSGNKTGSVQYGSIMLKAFLSATNSCKYLSAYRGRIYLLCSENMPRIIVFDYLK